MSYSQGDMIIGYLEELGRVVIRGIQIENATYEVINIIPESGNYGRVTKTAYWTSIEERNNKAVIKYKHSSTPHVNWYEKINCVNFLKEIKIQLFDKILNGDNYIVGEFNLIKTTGMCHQIIRHTLTINLEKPSE